jgi:hypothetical protein
MLLAAFWSRQVAHLECAQSGQDRVWPNLRVVVTGRDIVARAEKRTREV